ncbi:MAG: hypothetical protein JSV65_15130 [Armatimonadota bacterium]|nr:MAG: hypothetical protein JSV65_15130 [Armatimonadota bacterium]
MKLHTAYAINGKPVLGTYGRTDLEALALVKEVGMNLVFGGADLLDATTERGEFCRDNGIKVMYSITGHVHGRPGLSDDVTETQTEIPIRGGVPLPPPGPVQVDDELIRYREATPAALLGCERGAEGTTPAPHRAGIILFWPEPLAREVAGVQASPNLYGYYILDDSPGPALSALRGMYRVVRRADSVRPLCGGYSGATTLHNFARDAADVLMLYYYPVLKTGCDRTMTSYDTQWMLTDARRRVPGIPFFGIYQAFWGGDWNKQEPLTAAEVREQIEDFVREGASGLIAFYLAPDDGPLGGWNLNQDMQRVIRDANHEILSTGGLTVPPESPDMARARFQPTGHWTHPRDVPGIVPAWHVLAPFDDAQAKKLDAAFPPEDEVDLEATYSGKGRTIRWMTQRTIAGAVGFVELYGDIEHLAHCLAYATCDVTSPREQDVQMRFSSDDAAIVWLNGRQVWRHDGPRGVHWDSDVVPVKLEAGDTRVVVKVYNGVGQWGFFMRFTDADGKPPADLSFSPTL